MLFNFYIFLPFLQNYKYQGDIMYECFLEIAFEAELKNTDEDPECLALAFEQCNENPVTRDASIRELRDMIYGMLCYLCR